MRCRAMNENSLTTGLRRAATSQRPFRADRNPPTAYRLMPRAFRISTFRFFAVSAQKPPENRSAPTRARGRICERFARACVTLCHLRLCTTCARPWCLSSPWTPLPLFPLMSPSISHDLRARNAIVSTLGTLAPQSLDPFFRLLSPSIRGPSFRLHSAGNCYTAGP